MSENTKIEWADHTFNPWIGCTKVGPGCDNCYAKADFDDRRHRVVWGAGQPRSRTKTWGDPVKWNKQADAFFAEHGRRQRVFCASLADVFDNEVSETWRIDLFSLIEETPHLDWLLLTKRIGNVARMIPWSACSEPFANVWIGATVVNQEEADRDIPKLLAVPAAKRFLSMEPLLGPVDLTDLIQRDGHGGEHHYSALDCDVGPADDEWSGACIDWVIVGGESGPNARPMHPDWARSVRDQCQLFGVPFLFKQWGNWRPAAWFNGPDADNDVGDDFIDLNRTNHQFLAADGRTWDTFGGQYMYPPMPLDHWCLMVNEGKKAAGRQLDGRTWDELAPNLLEANATLMPQPTLENDSFVDKAIAQASICLWDGHHGGVTNAVQLFVRPLDVRGDESGSHPGETFVMVTITREEIAAMQKALDDDWADQIKFAWEIPA